MNTLKKDFIMKTKNSGFSLIELMVAMVIGIIVLLGLVSLFTNSSILNKAQTGLAALQENGRYAITRLKDDIEQAGRKHCASVAMPTDLITNWDQGYDMTSWQIENNVNLDSYGSTNGLPRLNDVELDLLSDDDQLPNTGTTPTGATYPLDPRYFIQGHECGTASCQPATTVVGADAESIFRSIGTTDNSRAAGTDILTVRYLNGGEPIVSMSGSNFNLANPVDSSTNPALIADCNSSIVGNANWGGNTVNVVNVNSDDFSRRSDLRAFDMVEDFKTVSYFVGIDVDLNGRTISSLYRSENGNVQQLVEGVERFDVFYLAQLQTGHVARLTAAQVQAVSGGGDTDNNGSIDGSNGCILPPKLGAASGGVQLANSPGCLWRSIYAMEIHLLLNTVNDSAMIETETFIYSPDSTNRQTPAQPLVPSGLNRERMYRREFTATVPIRSYTL